MFQLLGRQLRLTRGGKLFQQTHSIVFALAAIATFDKNTLARAMEGQGSAHAQYRHFSSEDEVGKAHAAAAGVGNSSVPPQPTIFTKILNKEIPADIVYEDDKVINYHLSSLASYPPPITPPPITPSHPCPKLCVTIPSPTSLTSHTYFVSQHCRCFTEWVWQATPILFHSIGTCKSLVTILEALK